MKLIENQTFWHKGDPINLADATLRNCAFNQCFARSVPRNWNTLSRLQLNDVSHWNCSLSGCIFDEVSIRNLKRVGSSPLFLWASVFRHTTLSGRISGLKINRTELNPGLSTREKEWRDNAAVSFYSTVDWALDISRAKFTNAVSFEAIPGDKIIRDHATQILITRERLTKTNWRSLDYRQTAIDIAISWFESGSLFDSVVIVPSSLSKYRVVDLEVMDMLRNENIAERD